MKVWRILMMSTALAIVPLSPASAQTVEGDVDEIAAEITREAVLERQAENDAAIKPVLDALLARKFDEAEAQALIWWKAQDWYKPGAAKEQRNRQRNIVSGLGSDAVLHAALAGKGEEADRLSAALIAYSARVDDEPVSADLPPAQLTAGIVATEIEKLFKETSVDFERYEKYLRASLAAIERHKGKDDPDLIDVLMLLGAAINKQGRAIEAQPFLERGLAMQLKHRGENHPQTLDFMAEIGRNLNNLGRKEDALAQYQRILVLAIKLHGPDDDNTLRARNNVAVAMLSLSRLAEAEVMLRDIYFRRQKLFGDDHEAVRRSALNLADALLDLGRFDEAEPFLEKAALGADGDDSDDKNDRADAATKMADVRAQQGKIDEAISLRRTALDLKDELYGPNSPETMRLVNDLAVLLSSAGQTEDAFKMFQRTLEQDIAVNGEDHPKTGTAWGNLASALHDLGRKEEAEDAFKKSIAIKEKAHGADAPELAAVYRNYGLLLDDLERVSEAQAYTRRSLAIEIKTLGEDHPTVARQRSNLAVSYKLDGRTEEAIGLWEAALKSLKGRVNPSNETLVGIKFLLASQLRFTPGRLDEAYGLASEAITAIRAGFVASAERGRGKDSHGNDSPFGVLMQIAWDKDQIKADPALIDAAFQAGQDLTIGPSSTAMAQAAARAAAGSGPLATLVRRKQDLDAQRRKTDAELIAALGMKRTTSPDSIRAVLKEIETELAKLNQEIDAKFPAYRALVSPAPLSLAQASAALDADEALLMIVPVHGHVFSFAITREGSDWHQAEGEDEDLRATLTQLRCQVDPHTCSPQDESRLMELQATPKGQEGFNPFDVQAAYDIYLKLIHPVEATLLGKKRLYVVTSGAYGDMPLSMLSRSQVDDGSDLADPAVLTQVDWLANHYAMTRLTAVSALRLPRTVRKAVEGKSFAGYGAPVLGGEALAPKRGANVYRSGNAADGSVRMVADPAVLRTLSPLPGTRVELNAMAKSLGAGAEALRMGDQATEAAFRADPRIKTSSILAFATHGLLPGEASSTNEPGLVMTPPLEAQWQNDGVLSASEVAELSLSAEWVILSACNTASPQGDKGADSLSGLARGFLYAGAHALLATHWRVSDDATAALTVETLTLRRTNPALTRGQALQAAMQAVRTGKRADGSAVPNWLPEWSHPAAWAPFSHIANHDE